MTIDRARRRITIVNAHLYASKQIIADLTFLGTARAEDGTRVPLAVHLKIEKKKTKIATDLHPHWTVRGKLTAAELEPFEVAYSDGTTEKVIATRRRSAARRDRDQGSPTRSPARSSRCRTTSKAAPPRWRPAPP